MTAAKLLAAAKLKLQAIVKAAAAAKLLAAGLVVPIAVVGPFLSPFLGLSLPFHSHPLDPFLYLHLAFLLAFLFLSGHPFLSLVEVALAVVVIVVSPAATLSLLFLSPVVVEL